MDIKTVIVILGISMLGGCSGVSIDLVSFTEIDINKLILLDSLSQENSLLIKISQLLIK